MVVGLINSLLIENIQSATQIATVAIFIPVLMAMGGNTSIQATAIAVREIAMGRLNTSMLWKTVAKQISIGTMMGFISGLFVWGGAYAVLTYINPVDVDISKLSLAIAISMWIGMIFASVFGSLVPIILNKFNIDPAIASGPFVTTSNDLSASTIYFITCMLLVM
jgi:magnesium transporter